MPLFLRLDCSWRRVAAGNQRKPRRRPEIRPPPETTTETTAAPTTETTEAPAAEGGIITTYITEPEFLQPPQTNESEGNAVLSALFRGLIDYDPETSEPVFTGVAESITSPDEGLTWEVVLKDGWTFHDGTPVTSQSFVDSWNYSAYGPNAAQVSGFFAPIAGYADLQCGTVTQPNPKRPVRTSTWPIARTSPPQRRR